MNTNTPKNTTPQRWRVTHTSPTGQRHRALVRATNNESATAQVLLVLGPAVGLSVIRLG